MLAACDENPLLEVYEVLRNAINKDSKITKYDISNEPILKVILENNGCGFRENCKYSQVFLKNTKDYGIYFLYDAAANKANDFYDYIEFFGMKYLIVFMDYFNDLFSDKKSEDEIENNLNEWIGNSVYVDAIKKIVDVYISTSTSAAELMGSLSSTAASSSYRFAGIFIAAKIIDELVGLTENDVDTINYKDLRRMLDEIPFQLLLLGIKFKE